MENETADKDEEMRRFSEGKPHMVATTGGVGVGVE